MKKQREDKGEPQHRRSRTAAQPSKMHRAYVLRLYITGSTPRAKAAVMKVKSFCEEHLKNHYQLDIIDIYQQPSEARDEQIIAAPTLIKKLPLPFKRMVGDFSKTDRMILALDL